MSTLKQITTRAKSLKKQHPNTKWTDLIKKASKELNGVHKHKKSSPVKNKKMAKHGHARTVIVAGKKKHTTRRRVSGIKKQTTMKNVLWTLAGSIAGGSIGSIVARRLPGSQLIKSVGTLGIGGAGMMFTGEKHPLLFGVFNGIGTAGGVNLLHTTGVMNGVEDMVSGIFDGMNGADELQGIMEQDAVIPINTAGHAHRRQQGLEGDYMGAYSENQIDKWVSEGIPGLGGDEAGWR